MKSRTLAIAAIIAAAASGQAAAQEAPTYAPFNAGKAPAVSLPQTAPTTVVKTVGPGATNPPEVTSTPETPRPKQTAEAPARNVPKPVTPPATSNELRYVPGTRISGVASVVDGHSLTVEGHAVRLHGAETPGLRQSCQTKSGTTWPCGMKAKDRLAALADGKKVNCTVVEQVGNGAAAYCSVRGIADLGQFLVREGLAVPNGHAGQKYTASAEAAKAVQAGIWTGRFEAPWTWRRNNP